MDKDKIASEALKLQVEIDKLLSLQEEKKVLLRSIAGGESLRIFVDGAGEIIISKPRLGGEKTGTRFKINEEMINANKELKDDLVNKGLLVEEDILSTSAVASVTIKPNV